MCAFAAVSPCCSCHDVTPTLLLCAALSRPAPPAGLPTPGTTLRVVDPDTLRDVADGQQGLILARGPGVMAGYYRDEAATAKVGVPTGFSFGQLGSASYVWTPGWEHGALHEFEDQASHCASDLAAARASQLIAHICTGRALQAFKAGDGWFDTGDLGWRAPAGVTGSSMAGCIVLTGVQGRGSWAAGGRR